MQKISVIGQGYVGLPLALAAAESGYVVTGIDQDFSKVHNLNKGISFIEDVSSDQLLRLIHSGRYSASTDFFEVKDSDIILICVPTPLTLSGKPDLQFLENAAKKIACNMKENCLVILESTVETGTTRNYLAKILEAHSHNIQFDIAFSPERIDPGNKKWNLKNTPKIIAGLSRASTKRSFDFYSKIVDNLVVCESVEIAETAKLLENTFRFINISFINEFAILCNKLGLSVNQVISAASTKPYGFMEFHPGLGVGGHCIPVDPLYLANKALGLGVSTRFINLADQINQEIPSYYVGRAEEKLGGLIAKKVLVIGVAYKPNIADVRESPVKALILGLRKKGAEVLWHDDLVKEWSGEKSSPLGGDFDLAILATPHDYLDLTLLGDVPIINTRGFI